jgi:hypothetical protein
MLLAPLRRMLGRSSNGMRERYSSAWVERQHPSTGRCREADAAHGQPCPDGVRHPLLDGLLRFPCRRDRFRTYDPYRVKVRWGVSRREGPLRI